MAINRISTSSVLTGSGTTITQSFTNNGGSLLVVGLSIPDTTTTVSITYNGVSLTINPNGANAYAQAGSSSVRNTFFYLFSPSPGTNNLVITPSNSGVTITFQIGNYSGVNTSGYDAFSVNGSTGSPTSNSATINTNNSWFIGFIEVGSGTFSNGTNFNFLGSSNIGLWDSNAGLSTGSKTATFNNSGGTQWSDQLMAFKPSINISGFFNLL